MHPLPAINYLAVLVAAIVIFILGGLWYSPMLFAKRWIALQKRTEEEMRAQAAASNMPLMYLAAFVCALLQASVMAGIIAHIDPSHTIGAPMVPSWARSSGWDLSRAPPTPRLCSRVSRSSSG